MRNLEAYREETSPGTSAASSPDQLSAVLSEILEGQIDAPQDALIAAVAGEFAPIVRRVFPCAFQALYLLTENSRRQVWHACFAADSATEHLSLLDQDPVALRHTLTHEGNERLLQQAYGAVPAGFMHALGKLGVRAREPSCYLALHKLLTADPACRHPLSQLSSLDERLIALVAGLGAKFARPNILDILHGRSEARAVGSALQDFIDYGLVSERDLLERLGRVERLSHLSNLIHRLYSRVPFPHPPIPGSDILRPIENAFRLASVGRRYRNCIATFIPDVIRGEVYFYEWLGVEPAVIQLRAERPFGWLLDTMAGARNGRPSRETRDTIEKQLREAGVRWRPSIDRIIGWTSKDDVLTELDQGRDILQEPLAETVLRLTEETLPTS